jgi:hypothetical protein
MLFTAVPELNIFFEKVSVGSVEFTEPTNGVDHKWSVITDPTSKPITMTAAVKEKIDHIWEQL